MKMQASAENYLETILILQKRNGKVRSIDIVHELDYSKPSISVAMKLLRKEDYIEIDDSGYITFTKKGKDVAERMYERHTILTNALLNLGVNTEVASKDACRIEHVISEESFEAIKNYLNRK